MAQHVDVEIDYYHHHHSLLHVSRNFCVWVSCLNLNAFFRLLGNGFFRYIYEWMCVVTKVTWWLAKRIEHFHSITLQSNLSIDFTLLPLGLCGFLGMLWCERVFCVCAISPPCMLHSYPVLVIQWLCGQSDKMKKQQPQQQQIESNT